MNRQHTATLFSLLLHAGLLLAALAASRLATPIRPLLVLDFSILTTGQAAAGAAALAAPVPARPQMVTATKKPPTPAMVKKSPPPKPRELPPQPAKPPQPPTTETIPLAARPVPAAQAQPQAAPPPGADAGPVAATGTAAGAAGLAGHNPDQGTGRGSGTGIYGVGQLDAPLTAVARTPPAYPPGAKRQNIEGWIKVAFVVDEQGRVDKVDILAAKPQGVFEQSVLHCVGSWRFKPATVRGMVVKAQVEQTITFKLES